MPDGKRLVITGGIGTGKSAVSGFLGRLGWSVLDADQVGHAVLRIPTVVTEVARAWPDVVSDGVIDRKDLGELVFADAEGLSHLEAITHPAIGREVDDWLAESQVPKAVEVSVARVRKPDWGPLVVVDASEELRLERAIGRGLERSAVLARMAAQPDRQEWLQLADYVISNAGSLRELEDAVGALSDYVLGL